MLTFKKSKQTEDDQNTKKRSYQNEMNKTLVTHNFYHFIFTNLAFSLKKTLIFYIFFLISDDPCKHLPIKSTVGLDCYKAAKIFRFLLNPVRL